MGNYFLPAFSGVGFSNNEFRWSSRIQRKDGLVRIVPGLGTRAVDRLSDDYPVLIAPGQPGLRVNVTIDEKIRYSPKKIDVINLQTNAFETVDAQELLKQFGDEYPATNQTLSILKHDHLQQPVGLGVDFEKDYFIITFEGLIARTPFLNKIHTVLKVLEQTLETPVDIEFASDGDDFYLLQCRPQSFSVESTPADIPRDVSPDKTIFTANRYISNGTVSNNTHIVYVDPEYYSKLSSRSDLLAVGRAVSQLNQILPKRQFVLMGPGRWGSRGDIKLGVSVTYSDISNASMLIEIARQKGNYLPDLSFGTHFFQDLVESSIRYLPLYPDDSGIIFNAAFLTKTSNILSEILPAFASLGDTVRVIDILQETDGLNLHVLMNGDHNEAVGILAEPAALTKAKTQDPKPLHTKTPADDHWRWRQRMAEKIAREIDGKRFGVKAFYIFGSTKNATAGPGSDIDILVHFQGNKRQREDLLAWLEAWSLALGEMNFLRTGLKSNKLLDIHIVTDEDIKKRTSYTVKIGAVTDAARPLPLGKASKES